ncbi:MAG: YkgJ family cysteine cluster protein [Candidatus Bathyarchaeia archaeon]
MQFVPWQSIADWKCIACGYCCKLYSVVLKFPEWLRIVKTFGVEKTVAGLNQLYLKRASDGSCVFLCNFGGIHYCGLQNMKPIACKLWPFKVLTEPKYGQTRQAAFDYNGIKLFIYADTMCLGLRYGTPTWEFNHLILREFVELAVGIRQTQSKSTSNLVFASPLQVRRFSLL